MNTERTRYYSRARELMLPVEDARRYASIYEQRACPDCGQPFSDADLLESKVCSHARCCKGTSERLENLWQPLEQQPQPENNQLSFRFTEKVAALIAREFPGTLAEDFGMGIYCVVIPSALRADDRFLAGTNCETWAADYYPSRADFESGWPGKQSIVTAIPSESSDAEAIAAALIGGILGARTAMRAAEAEGGAR